MSGPASLPAGVAEILQLFSGRRRGRRSACELDLQCRGRFRTYSGKSLNVSRVGALVLLEHRRFCELGSKGLLGMAGRLYTAFPNGMLLTFPAPSIEVRATVARVTQDPATGLILLGCAFRKPLTRAQCAKLNVSADEGDLSE